MSDAEKAASTDLREVADQLRNRVDLFGKTLAAVATLGTGAVGLAEVGDLFPAEGNTGWVVAACIGLALSALAAIFIAVRLMLVGRPVFLRPDLDANDELSSGEKDAVRPVFAATATRFGYQSLVGLQERERALRRAATWCSDEDERARRTARADEVKAAIDEAMARGMVVTVRRRATEAVSGRWPVVAYVLVIAGLLAFTLGTDKVSSDRVDPIAEAKACGEARKAGATAGELARSAVVEDDEQVSGCDAAPKEEAVSAGPPQLTRAAARAKIVSELSKVVESCVGLVGSGGAGASETPLRAEDCAMLRGALGTLNR